MVNLPTYGVRAARSKLFIKSINRKLRLLIVVPKERKI
jgi:hypothetical protein